jgi:hypothetical protein
VAEIVLQGSGIVPVIGKLIAARMPQHVGMHGWISAAGFPGDGQGARNSRALRLRFGLCEDHFWPEDDFGRSVSGPRNPVSPMQIDPAGAVLPTVRQTACARRFHPV